MKQQTLVDALNLVLADSYALFLKTQNYHWHFTGANFMSVHEMLEEFYRDLLNAVDDFAERIVILGAKAPATFAELSDRKTLADGNSSASGQQMLQQLHNDQGLLVETLYKALKIAQGCNDEASIGLLSERISVHEKHQWMLRAHLS